MLDMLTHGWRMVAVRGIAAIAFGILALVWPGQTLGALVLLFGAYAIVDGASLLAALIRGDAVARRNGWAVGAMGVLGIIVGIATFVWPGVTALALLYLVAFWAISMGLLQIYAAITLRREIDGELWLGLGGLLSVAFGVLLVVFPGDGLVSLIWILGIWAIAFGISSLVLAYRLRGLAGHVEALAHPV